MQFTTFVRKYVHVSFTLLAYVYKRFALTFFHAFQLHLHLPKYIRTSPSAGLFGLGTLMPSFDEWLYFEIACYIIHIILILVLTGSLYSTVDRIYVIFKP